jgi:hypothetical protein
MLENAAPTVSSELASFFQIDAVTHNLEQQKRTEQDKTKVINLFLRVYFPRRLGGACNCSHLRFLYHNLVPKELRVNDAQLGRAVGSYIRFGDFEDKYKKKEDLENGTPEEDMDNSTAERPLKKIRRQIHLEE